jgi:uncharacterized cupin superfamily protein
VATGGFAFQGDSGYRRKKCRAEDLRYLAVSIKLSLELCDYPDSGKFGVLTDFPPDTEGKPLWIMFVGRDGDSRDYWEGE